MLQDTSLDVSLKPPFSLEFTPDTLPDGIELGFVGLGLVALPIIVITYKRINARREAIVKEAGESGGLKYSDDELRRMGDKSPYFRYGT